MPTDTGNVIGIKRTSLQTYTFSPIVIATAFIETRPILIRRANVLLLFSRNYFISVLNYEGTHSAVRRGLPVYLFSLWPSVY